jgi:hypothetical protein
MIGAAAAVGAGRLLAQDHYASDVVLGTGLGVFAGYIVPSALHYGFGGHDHQRPGRSGESGAVPFVRISAVPLVGPSTMGAQVFGLF